MKNVSYLNYCLYFVSTTLLILSLIFKGRRTDLIVDFIFRMNSIHILFLLLSLLKFNRTIQDNCLGGHCDEDNSALKSIQHEKEKYTKIDNNKEKWQKYLSLIEKALLNYKECSAEDCHIKQRRHDFRFWIDRGGITKEDFAEAKRRNLGEHYQIIDHHLYRQDKCMFPSRCSGNEHFILKIVNKLPNMELIINSHDWPKDQSMDEADKAALKTRPSKIKIKRPSPSQVKAWAEPAPVFSFSKTSQELDVLYPAWTFWKGGPAVSVYPTGLGRWDLMRKTLITASEDWSWVKKIEKAFFRGSRTSEERDPLVLMSRAEPDLADAQYTKNQAWKSPKDTLEMEPAKEVSMEEHCKYKYLFNFRGVAASFRLKHLFLCGSLVFHVGDEWIEFFYGELKPWVHYIPVSTNLNEVRELLMFAKENDDVVKEIAQRGFQFINRHLRMENIQDYWYKVLKRYSKLMKWTPVKDKSLIEIKPTR